MKTRKIIDICKRSGHIFLFDTEREQWISDGCAVFPMFNLPRFDENSLYKTYDITDKQANKIIFRHEAELPSSYNFNDVAPGENIVERGPVCITDAGRSLIPYATSQGVVFIDAKYLQPLADIENDMLELYERKSKNGQIYFAAKTGFMLVGIILPVDVINVAFVSRLKTLAVQCDIALFNMRSAEREKAKVESEDQKTLFDKTEGGDE